MAIYKEYTLPPEQMKAWLGDRQGAIVGTRRRRAIRLEGRRSHPDPGDDLAAEERRHDLGVQPGRHLRRRAGRRQDAVLLPLRLPRREPRAGRRAGRLVHRQGQGPVSSRWRWRRPSTTMFANSQAETKTTTEKGFIEGFAKQIGDIGSIMIAILVAVLFTILLVVGNTMAQAVRERTSELAVLKTLGFSDAAVLALVLAESLFVAVVGGGLGLFVAWLIVLGGDPDRRLPAGLHLPARDIVIGVVLMVARRRRRGHPAGGRARCASRSPTRCARRKDLSHVVLHPDLLGHLAERPDHPPAPGLVGGRRRRHRRRRHRVRRGAVDRRGLPGGDEERRPAAIARSSCAAAPATRCRAASTATPPRSSSRRPASAARTTQPLASPELYVIVDLPKRSTMTPANVPLRGIDAGDAAGALRRPHRPGADARRSAPTRSSPGAPRRRTFAGLSVGSHRQDGRR